MTSRWNQYPSKSSRRCTQPEWKRIRIKVLTRDEHICQIRGPRCTVEATTVDHVIPVAQHGTDDPSNLASACWNCHKAKTAREAAHGRNRWKRRPEPHPSDLLRGEP
jgi:5-methylcytosine-specific restriction endonuclease McrA